MGIIRGGLSGFVGILLFVTFLAGVVVLTLELSLDYDNVKLKLVPFVKDFTQKEFNINQVAQDAMPEINEHCKNNSEYIFVYEDEEFTIACDIAIQGSDAVVQESVEELVYDLYYGEYDCDFWDCLSIKDSKKSFVFFSEKAKEYWNGKFYFLLIFSLVLIGLMFFLVEHKTNLFVVVGGLLIIAALPLRKIDSILKTLIPKSFEDLFAIFISQANSVNIIVTIIGVVLVGLGVIFRILRWDSFKKKFSKRDVQEMVKTEISKSKKSKGAKKGILEKKKSK